MKTQNQHTFKLLSIITVIFFLQIDLLSAAKTINHDLENNFSNCIKCLNNNAAFLLAPMTPAEATFSDEAPNTEINFAPTTPAEATFDDGPESISPFILKYLAPATSSEASFDDGPTTINTFNLLNFAPTAPVEADFND